MTRTEQKTAKVQKEVDAFNAAHPVGTRVRFWTGLREGEGKVSTTRSDAQALSGHTAVVWLTGVSGCVSLSHVQAEKESC